MGANLINDKKREKTVKRGKPRLFLFRLSVYSEREDNTLFLEIDTFDGCVIHAKISVTNHKPRLKTIFKRRTSEIEEKREERMVERAAIRAKQKEKKKG